MRATDTTMATTSASGQQSQLLAQLQQLSQKVTLLAEAYAHARQELEKAEKEKAELQEQLNYQRQKAKDFQKQFKFNTIASMLAANPTDTDALKSKLDQYIKEIDTCIAFLSR